jgi:excisionase family DNA binding protein
VQTDRQAAQPTNDAPFLVDAAEAARLLGMGRRTFDRFVATGVLPAPDVKLGRKFVRWRRSTIESAPDRLAEASHETA